VQVPTSVKLPITGLPWLTSMVSPRFERPFRSATRMSAS
jgi:hypothetical protein